MTVRMIVVLIVCGIALFNCAPTEKALPARKTTMSDAELKNRLTSKRDPAILFIGNSYSFHLAKAFRQASSAYGKRVTIDEAVHSGWTLARHARHSETLKKIRERPWDAIIIQEHSLIPSYPQAKRDALMLEPLQRLVAEARAVGALPILFQTWGRRDGYRKLAGDDFYKMSQRLREGYRAAAKAEGGLFIIPVGDRWQDEMKTGRGLEFYQIDGSHPSSLGTQWISQVMADYFFKT